MHGKVRFDRVMKMLPLAVVLLAVASSFVYGWFFDHSKPFIGAGWYDQKTYTLASDSFAGWSLPDPAWLHFSVGYSLLGAVGHAVSPGDPFLAVSFVLLMGSAVFCFFAARRLFGALWAVIFCLLLFYWDFAARSFSYSSELFAVPWNNQVFFFTMAFYFWLFTVKVATKPSWRLLIATSIVSGYCFLTREETLLFVVPAMVAYLVTTKSDWRRWAVCFGVIGLCYLPQIIIKMLVFGNVTKTEHRGGGYTYALSRYFRPTFVHRNVWETIIDSRHVPGKLYPGPNVHRPALLQAVPWLWVSPIGIALMLALKKYSLGLKIFVGLSCLVILFYLSGSNMSAQKLPFHCLRYISPAFIALNLAVIVAVRESLFLAQRTLKKTKAKIV